MKINKPNNVDYYEKNKNSLQKQQYSLLDIVPGYSKINLLCL